MEPLLEIIDAHHHMPAADDYSADEVAAQLVSLRHDPAREHSVRVVGQGYTDWNAALLESGGGWEARELLREAAGNNVVGTVLTEKTGGGRPLREAAKAQAAYEATGVVCAGFGRIVISELEAPNTFANMV